jgi:hypothetical protein
MLRRKKKAPEVVQDTVLSDRLSFLDVVLETCQRTGRYTVIADSGDETYTVMIDRGGPFNVEGGGATGRPALVKASTLRRGTYSVIEGWPVDQPKYQLGLDDALQGLKLGTKPEAKELPPARGVDAMRDPDWDKAATEAAPANGTGPDPFEAHAPGIVETDPYGQSARNGGALHPFVQPAGPWMVAAEAPPETLVRPEAPPPHSAPPALSMPTFQSPPPAPDHAREQGLSPVPAADLAGAPAPGVVAEAAGGVVKPASAPVEADVTPWEDDPALAQTLESRMAVVQPQPAATPAAAEPDDTISYLRQVARASDATTEDEAPVARKKQGWLKSRIMRFLLWTVEVDGMPEHYTLGQVLKLVLRSTGSALALIVRPVVRPFISRFHRTKEDWRISGEVASRQKARRAKPTATKPSKLRR